MKQQHNNNLALTALFCAALLTFTSCESLPEDIKNRYFRIKDYISEQIELFAIAYREVPELISKEYYSTPELTLFSHIEKVAPSERLTGEYGLHTELLDTVYNSTSSLDFHEYGDRDMLPSLVGESMLTEAATSGYTLVKFESYQADKMLSSLRDAGIEPEVITETNPAPSSTVYAISYTGVSDAVGFYIDPMYPVKLHVSGEKKAVKAEKNEKNTVYITYDDGPTERNTVKLLDILDSYGVKAAFFTTGSALEKYPESAKKVIDRGHSLGCHTVSHNYAAIYRSVDTLTAEIKEWEKIADGQGIKPASKLFRFPGGSVGKYLTGGKNEKMISALENMGYTVFDWNVVSNDSILYMRPEDVSNIDYIKESFLSTLESSLKENEKKDNAPIIILMHETVDETVALMPWMLEYLISEGYKFGDLGELSESWTFADRQ